MACSVEEALQLGADAVSIQVNLGSDDEKDMLRDFGYVARKTQDWGIPLIAMVYASGPKIKDEYDPQVVKHAARAVAELGADIVKVSYTGSVDTFSEVVNGCFVPVVIAGGKKMETDLQILEIVCDSIKAGGAGVSIGRNVFQHRNPEKIVKAIFEIVHNGISADEALKMLSD